MFFSLTKKKLSFFIKIGCFFVLVFLLLSVVKSGYNYIFDVDELLHSHIVYLLAAGYKPYVTIYYIFSPIFHWFLMPIFTFFGFTFQTIFNVRIIMIVLFILRLFFAFLIAKKIFSKRVAYWFLFLLLCDPFTVFAAMQIRPDNLMLTVYTLGLTVFTYGLMQSSLIMVFFSGAIMVLAFLISIKIAPSLLVLGIIITIFFLKRRQFKLKAYFFGGLILPTAIFILYFISQNSLFPMLRQMFIDSQVNLNAILFPTQINFFYGSNNEYVFGLPGKPLNWLYVWFLPALAFAGMFLVWRTAVKKDNLEIKDVIKVILACSLLVQWLSLFFLHTAFIQYYLPVTWLFALLAAYTIDDAISFETKSTVVKNITKSFFYLLLAALVFTSIKANLARAKFDGRETINRISLRWKQIPADKAVFPSLIFRPLAYPLPHGIFIGDMPASILKRYPEIHTLLETNKVEYLLLNDFYFPYLKPETVSYIRSHYKKVEEDEELWIRKTD